MGSESAFIAEVYLFVCMFVCVFVWLIVYLARFHNISFRNEIIRTGIAGVTRAPLRSPEALFLTPGIHSTHGMNSFHPRNAFIPPTEGIHSTHGRNSGNVWVNHLRPKTCFRLHAEKRGWNKESQKTLLGKEFSASIKLWKLKTFCVVKWFMNRPWI